MHTTYGLITHNDVGETSLVHVNIAVSDTITIALK